MADLSSLIAQGLKPPIDYSGAEKNALSLRDLAIKNQQAEQGLQDDAEVRLATMQAPDQATLYKILMAKGLAKQAFGMQENALKAQKTQADIAHVGAQTAEQTASAKSKDYDRALKQADTVANNIDTLLSSGTPVSPIELIKLNNRMKEMGVYGTGDAAELGHATFLKQMPDDPQQLIAFAKQIGATASQHKERVKAEHDAAVLAETKNQNVVNNTLNDKKFTQQVSNEGAMRDISRGQLGVAQGHLAIAKDRLNLDKAANAPGAVAPLKPIPPSSLKLQQEGIDAISIAGGLEADMGGIINQIDNKKLKLGPVENLVSRAKNASGQSTENSRNYNSFKSTMEKLRNDSLRLNKGTQTEGDAVRAWNELFENLSDEKVVKQRLQEVQAINRRAIQLQKNNVNNIRQNFGHPEMDFSKYENQMPTVGDTQKPSLNDIFK